MLRMCKFYSLEPISPEVRKNFTLPSWPFYNGPTGPIPPDCLQYFQKLRIIHWNDPNSKVKKVPNSIMVPDENGYTPDELQPPLEIKAYRHLVSIDLDTFKVAEIPKEYRGGISDKDWLDFYGDFKWWLECNTLGTIYGISNTRVKFVIDDKTKGRGLHNLQSFRPETG